MTQKNIYPDPLASWKEKQSIEYGTSYAKHIIAKEWFNGGMINSANCEYASRSQYIIDNRLLVRGMQNTDDYKKHMARQTGDLDYLNLTWKPVNIPGKFCRIVYNGISDENYALDIRANDRISLMNKKKKMEDRRNTMRSMPLLKKVKEQLGINLIPQGFIPQDEEELRLYSEIKDRPKIEIAEELMIDYIDKTNKKDYLEAKKNKDLVEIGISAERVWTDPYNGVSFEYVDPEYLVHSYTSRNDFSDVYYYGYVDTITIDDLKRESNFDDKKLREIAKAYANLNKAKNVYYDSCDFRDLLGHKVHVLRFAFKTTKTRVYKAYKKKGTFYKVVEKDENYNPPERSDYGKVQDVKDTWMEGTYIIDSDFVYNYKECENIIRDERNEALAPFNVKATDIQKNILHSFLDDIKVPNQELQYIHLKMQHLTAELKPDLTIINEDALADLSGSGKKQQMWQETLNLLNVKGVIIEKTIDIGEMGTQRVQAARPSGSQQGSALAALLNQWVKYYELIRETTGINPARDGSLPHDALLGVNQMAQLASNTATKHIVDTSVSFNKTHAELISTRLHQIFSSKQEGAKDLVQMYERAVGKHNIDVLEVMKDRHLHDFGFTVNMLPTQQELKEFREDLSLFIQTNGNDIESIAVKNEAQQIAKTNTKLATQYLFYMAKKINQRRMEEQMKLAKQKAEEDRKSNIAATQAKTQSAMVEAQIEVDKESKIIQLRLAEKQAMQQIEAPEKEREFKEKVFLEQLKSIAEMDGKKYLEDRKDQRVDKQSTQQSKMITQRNYDTGPINFEQEDLFRGIFGN
jgi:hypothetical protein|tara:strand:+ start:44982 stop:47396 length:2415 start_codon:yes stop_codon:yes gene_type:complete